MLGKIIAINESIVSVKLDVNINDYEGLISKNVVFKDTDTINIGEVIAIGNGIMQVTLVGEVKNNKFMFGDITKPSFKRRTKFSNYTTNTSNFFSSKVYY